MTINIYLYCLITFCILSPNGDLTIPVSPIEKFNIKNIILKSTEGDTTKNKNTANLTEIYYVIAGSFLIPKNADEQLFKLKNLGFNKSYRYNFPDSEFYSVVVDTFNAPSEYLKLTESLQKNKVDYFIKKY